MRISQKYDVTLNDVANYLLRPKKEIKKNKTNTAAITGAALSGFVTGFTAALLFTPESGDELREDIAQVYQEAAEKLSQLVSEAKNNMG